MRQLNREPAATASPPALEQYRQISALVEKALASNELDCFQAALLRWFQFEWRHDFPDPLFTRCATPFAFDAQRFATLPPPIRLYLLQQIFHRRIPRLIDLAPQVDFLRSPGALAGMKREFQRPFLYLLVVALLLRGEVAQAEDIFNRHRRKLGSCGLRGWLLFLADDFPAAIRAFTADLTRLRRREQNPTAFFTGFEGLIMLLALLVGQQHRHLAIIRVVIGDLEKIQPLNPLLPTYRILGRVVAQLENHPGSDQALLAAAPPADDAVATLFDGLARVWLTGTVPTALQPVLRELGDRAQNNGYAWLAAGCNSLLQVAARHGPPAKKIEQATAAADGSAAKPKLSWNLAELIEINEPWHHAILALNREGAATEQPGADLKQRLAWQLLYEEEQGQCELKPVLQHRRPDGSWSRGRRVALQRLAAAVKDQDRKPEFYLEPRDRAICAGIESRRQKGNPVFALASPPDLSLLVDHPRLFLASSPDLQVQLEPGQPALLIESSSSDQLRLRLNPYPTTSNQVVLRRGENLFQLITFSPALRQLAAQLGPRGLPWPLADRARLEDFLAGLPDELTIFSCLDLNLAGNDQLAPDSRVIVQFFPAKTGLRLRLRVRPMGREGPDLEPGRGSEVLWAKINGRRCRLRRDLAAELDRARELASLCGLEFKQAPPPGGSKAAWNIDEPQKCLEILTRLHAQKPPVPQEWPAGRTLSASPTVELHQLRLKIGKKNDWFELEGQLQLDDGLVVELESLLRAAHRGSGRFVPLGHGRFLSLSRELRRKIDEIEAFAEIQRRQVRLHPLAAHLLLAADGAQGHAAAVETDQHWQNFMAGMQRARQLKPAPPTGLKTSLRHYQLVGYRWLMQMAAAGLGACLADDMGLGKTIQALALLLARSEGGPSLVVAPTSLGLNWQEEAARFAPSLKTINYSGRKRRHLLADLGPATLVICSYGMLQRDAEALGAVHWQTVVLDEAQAIKNFLSKRSRAAMRLRADCKLITTGTPLENHLSELWTLFSFINPGLLGSLEQFRKKFIVPIEQHHDQAARHRLQKLLTPFILRRLKSEVLQELPPRTDITLQVTMHREEAALYEALRRQARETLQHQPGHQRRGAPLQVLAEIMKLRRACCHPRLVMPDSEMTGAKLELFAKVVSELRENRHRILVFSQFVDHLTIIRQYLDEQRISYQYFDGATPAGARQQRVRDFQEGRGELFLISLRTGGLGLNLTAADYVIHLDPWWNPAVEEQASDRAHRIGQDKPVTIYRLITTGTIEEKIRAMHQKKRRLAADLLDANRSGPPRSYEELLALLN